MHGLGSVRKARRTGLHSLLPAFACRFGSARSIPQVCRSLQKAAYDPRVCGILLKISPLSVRGAPTRALALFLVACNRTVSTTAVLMCLRQVGWARLQEIREYIAFFRQSGKFSMAFLTTGAEKEYYLASACEVSTALSADKFQLLFGSSMLTCTLSPAHPESMHGCMHRRFTFPQRAT